MTNWKKVKQRYETELLGQVIPFWENHCIDREYGGYFTCLDQDGSRYDDAKYMWMQWRIVYMFATLYRSRYRQERWLDLARQGYDFLTRHGKAENGSYYFALNRRGEPTVAAYNIFSDCFAAMGAAAMFHATGEAQYRREAETAMANYLGRMDNPKGRWNKLLPGAPVRQSLSTYMILANLGSVMRECLATDQYDAATAEAVNTVMTSFRHPEFRVIFENINRDGSVDLDSCDGRQINPGHGLESLWFIMRHDERRKQRQWLPKAVETVGDLLEFGWDREYGGIYYFRDVLGRPNAELQADMKLWWVHNEALLATLFAYRLTGDTVFRTWFDRLDAWTWAHFPDPAYGEWFAYLDRRGQPSHRLKGGKWKAFFHLPRFLLIGLEQLETIITMEAQKHDGTEIDLEGYCRTGGGVVDYRVNVPQRQGEKV